MTLSADSYHWLSIPEDASLATRPCYIIGENILNGGEKEHTKLFYVYIYTNSE